MTLDGVLMSWDGAATGGMDLLNLLVPFAIFFTVWYVIVLRPQQQEKDQREAMLSALVVGDDVVTTGGLYGRIVEIQQDVLFVELAAALVVRVDRAAVSRKSAPTVVK